MHTQTPEGIGRDIVCRDQECTNGAALTLRLEVEDGQEGNMVAVTQQLDGITLVILLPMPTAITIEADRDGMTAERMVISPCRGERCHEKQHADQEQRQRQWQHSYREERKK